MTELSTIEAARPSKAPTVDARKSKQSYWIAGGVVVLLVISTISVVVVQSWRRTPKLRMTLQPPGDHVARSIAFSPDGKIMAAVGYDTVWLWNAQTGELLQTLKQKLEDRELDSGNSLAFSPDSKTLAVSFASVVTLFEVQTGMRKLELKEGMSSNTVTVAFSPDGRTLATGTPLRLWDAQTGQLKRELTTKFSHIWMVAFSPDGKTLAVIDMAEDKYLYVINLWDMQTFQVKRSLPVGAHPVDSMAFSPDGMTVVSGNSFDGMKVWDAQTGELKRELDVGPVSMAFSPDGRMLAFESGRYDESLKKVSWLYDAQSWTPIHNFDVIRDVVFSPDSKVLAGKRGGGIEFWDVSGLK